MSIDKLVNHLIAMDWEQRQRDRPQPIHNLKFERKCKDLIRPANQRAQHHREREQHYTKELERVEKRLREEGLSVEVVDPVTGLSMQTSQSLCSGAVSMGYWPTNVSSPSIPKFTPRVNQDMLQAVEKAKTKMLEHRDKAEKLEQYARALRCCPETTVELTIADADWLKLEE